MASVVSYRTGVLVGAVLGTLTFFAWLVGYWCGAGSSGQTW